MSSLRELLEEWLPKNGLKLAKKYTQYLFPYSTTKIGEGLPEEIVSLLHKPLDRVS